MLLLSPLLTLVSPVMNCHNERCFISPERQDGFISVTKKMGRRKRLTTY